MNFNINGKKRISFEDLRNEVKTITFNELDENRKTNVWFTNFNSGMLLSHKEIIQLATLANLKIVYYDYVRMLVYLEDKN